MNTAQSSSSFRDKVATVDQAGKRLWVYAQQPKGKLYKIRTWVSIGYLIIFFMMPLIRVDGHPLFMLNVLKRKFILFGQIFWPQDFFIFGLGMVIFVIFIALFTVVFGRVFCGWACPQTIFMEMVFRKIEYWFEGNATEQKMLDKAPWYSDKIIRRGGKWVLFWLISFLIANTFLAYMIGIEELRMVIREPIIEHLPGFFILLIFTTIFFFVYLRLREQVCTTICPYGRMQGVLMDADSIVVAYDHSRGEPRGKFKKHDTRSIGDCIDCTQCVKVCPTGIDIRNGTQLECISCTACIDACDRMMKAAGLETGLIRYASENNITGKKPFRFTGRMKAYMVVMVLLLGVEVYLLGSRTDIGISILKTPGQLFQNQPGQRFSNLYNYRLLNKTFKDKTLEFRPEGFEGSIEIVGNEPLLIPKEGYTSGAMFIYIDENKITKRKTNLNIGVYENGIKIKTIPTSFLGPFNDK